ncbi:succinyldiaminopimelate aminotransferase [Vibrio coralliilyticus]|nr:succinyldiaminopimelate aminotransferase [Vibrio coralliilyticus]
MTPQVLFQSLWNDYIQRLCPSADKVHHLLQENEPLINDHIALRTFNVAPLGIETLAKPFTDAGYKPCGDYEFESKKLVAKHFEHPDPKQPKVFISELKVNECSPELQAIVAKLVEQLDTDKLKGHEFLSGGRLWDLSFADYQLLAKESEYASWLAAHGYGANHFTVSVNQLDAFEEVKCVNDHLREAGFTINESGGEVKGSPDVLLEQSSTMADKVPVTFTEGTEMVPGGFYEFAKRYPMSNGELYPGFVAASADKIFESTNG